MPPLAALFVRAHSGMFSAEPDWGRLGPLLVWRCEAFQDHRSAEASRTCAITFEVAEFKLELESELLSSGEAG